MKEHINSIMLGACIVLGSIKNASQGQFSINEEYTTPHIKKIRVVTTIDYYLK